MLKSYSRYSHVDTAASTIACTTRRLCALKLAQQPRLPRRALIRVIFNVETGIAGLGPAHLIAQLKKIVRKPNVIPLRLLAVIEDLNACGRATP